MAENKVSDMVTTLRQAFEDGILKSINTRKEILHKLISMLDENHDVIIEALHKDMGKSRFETISSEITCPKAEALFMLKNMDKWLSDEYVSRSLLTAMDTPYVQRQPYGVVLIIGPWNYPFWAILQPLIGAIAAGNTVLIKPSEYAVESSKVLTNLIAKYINQRICQVCRGDAEMCKNLLANEKFDYLFFTGGEKAGRAIYTAAAQNLTPVTLELGGKCPAYIDSKVYLKMAAKRIIWSKVFNNGQTCIAADYALCHRDVVEDFKKALCDTVEEFLGKDIKENSDYARIINRMHFNRLINLLENSKGNVICGGQSDESNLYIAPTVVADVTTSDSLMSEELFGPILPIVTVDSAEEAVRVLRSKAKPLAAYVFTNDAAVFENFKQNTYSGSLVQNGCALHVTISELPFGGIGNSGIGHYRGRYSIDTFSHQRGVLLKTTTELFNDRSVYPPYCESKENLMTWALEKAARGGCSVM